MIRKLARRARGWKNRRVRGWKNRRDNRRPNRGARGWPGGGDCGLLDGMDLVVVDVETTGLRPEQCDLIEIGAVRLSGGQVSGEFFSLVRPPGPVPAGITGLTGISEEMVRRAPPPAVALQAFLSFASGSVLVAHHAAFDLGFLSRGCAAAGLPWPPAAVLDTAVLARLVLSPEQVPDCKLATLARYFRTRVTPSHRALADAQATAEVLLGLLGRVRATAAAARAGKPAPPGPPWPPRPAARPDGPAGSANPAALAEPAGVAAVR